MILTPDLLGRLESLNVSSFYKNISYVPGVPNHVQFQFGFPGNLKKLALSRFRLSQSETSTIGELPNLEVLKLSYVNFNGETREMVEGEFSKLRFSKLANSEMVRWRASKDQFPDLQKLVLEGCESLEEVPSCLENIPTLEMIEVSYCSHSVASFFLQIQELQMDTGNSFLKIHILHDSAESS